MVDFWGGVIRIRDTMSTVPAGAGGKRDLTSGPLLGNLLRLALPLAAGMILNALYNLVDAFWLGRWSREALAAPGVSMPFIFVVVSFAMGFGTAGTALVAQFTGAARYREADRAAGQVLMMLSILVAVMATPMVLMTHHILRLFQVPAEMMPQAVIYMRIIMTGLPVTAFTIAYGAVLRALGDTITVVVIGVVSNLLNMVLDPLLIFGLGGLPPMGVSGAALATVISQVLAAIACYVLLRRGRAGLHVRVSDFKPDWPILGKTFSVGLPAAVGNSSNSLGFAVFQLLVNSLGVTVIGAFTIGWRLINFFNVPGQSFALAAAPVVGQALGAGKPQVAHRAVKVSVMIVAIGTLLPAAFLIFEGQLVARFFVNDAPIIAESGRFFRVVPASSYLFGVIMVLTAAFYGSGHTKPVMVLAILRLWVLRLPAAWLLGFVLGWGSMGVYWGMVIGNIFSALVAVLLFKYVDWQKAVVPTRQAAIDST